VFKGASTHSGSFYSTLALVSPRWLLPAINLAAHTWPDAAFRRTLEARLTLSSASLALVKQARQQLEHERQEQQQGAADAGSDSDADAAVAVVPAGQRAAAGTVDTGFMRRHKGSLAPGSFLSLMLSARDKAGQGLTDLQVLMQANTFTLAGVRRQACAHVGVQGGMRRAARAWLLVAPLHRLLARCSRTSSHTCPALRAPHPPHQPIH
jgi:hypothetical protein